MDKFKNIKKKFVICFAILALISTLIRLFFGFDLSDESQYLAQSFGPVIGGSPFITDRLFQQTGSLLLTPIFWLYFKLVGSTQGLVVLNRFIFYFVGLLTAGTLYKSFRMKWDFSTAFGLAVLPVLYIPFGIPSISYNTVALLFTLSALAHLRIMMSQPKYKWWPVVSILLALAIFSYPPLILPYAFLIAKLWSNESFRKSLVRVTVLGTTILAILAGWVISIGIDQIIKNINLTKSVSLFPPEVKIKNSLIYLKVLFPGWIAVGFYIVWTILGIVKKWRLEFIALPILILSYFPGAYQKILESHAGVILYGTLTAILMTLIDRFRFKEEKLLSYEMVTGLLVATVMTLSSGNAFLNATIGFSIFLLFLLENSMLRTKVFPVLAWASLVVSTCFSQWSFFYRESHIEDLDHVISAGPFVGLITNSTKQTFIDEFRKDLDSVRGNSKTIFCYDSFPACYLFTDLVPLTFMYYMHPIILSPLVRKDLVEFYSLDANRADVIVETNGVPAGKDFVLLGHLPNEPESADIFRNYFANSNEYARVISKTYYSIYIRKK